MNTYLASFGIEQLRGGWLITEQHIITAKDSDRAWRIAYRDCPKGEQVYDVMYFPNEDKELLEYESIDVI